MLVEINQWRAAIGCFRASVQISSPLRKSIKLFSTLFQILKLFWFCYSFIAISILALPCAITMHSVTSQSCFLPLFARVHHFAKTVLYTTLEIFKRILCFNHCSCSLQACICEAVSFLVCVLLHRVYNMQHISCAVVGFYYEA